MKMFEIIEDEIIDVDAYQEINYINNNIKHTVSPWHKILFAGFSEVNGFSDFITIDHDLIN